MLRFKNFLNESSLTEQEKDALWYWQEGNNGKGYLFLRSIANGRYPNVRGIEKLKDKKIILNKSCLSNKDVTEFEYEANVKVFYNIPALDDHVNNNVLEDFLSRLSIFDATAARKEDGNKIFGIFGH